MKLLPFVFVLILAIVSTAYAQELNAKTLETVKIDIVQSGTLYITGFVHQANLSYYIPQEGLKDVKVVADGDMTWRYTNDQFGNRLILIEWKRMTGVVNYRIELTVENTAKHTYNEKEIGTNSLYLAQTKYIIIDDEIRKAAFPYQKTLRRAAELTSFVYNYLDYDLSYVGKNVPSDKVFEEKRGVCVEHANLLAAMLRANGIPTRYVVGYAYSSVQEKFVGHTWVEILAADGSWIPLDPTWLEAGYLDAAHIKSAVLLDNNQIDTLTYLGGDIRWTRNEEQIQLLEYTEKGITGISATGTDKVNSQNYGYVVATITSNECTMTDLRATSCVNNRGFSQFDILEAKRNVWTCGTSDAYWFFKTSGSNYICPISVYDQMGGQTEFRVTVQGQSSQSDIFVSGPDTVKVGETFRLAASTSGIFYSPDFGVQAGREFALNIKKPGTYKFYLYYFGSLHEKTVNVVEIKEFDLNIKAPFTANINEAFQANITVRNLGESRTTEITVGYTNQSFVNVLSLSKDEEKNFSVKFVANDEGVNQIVASAIGNSIQTHTFTVNTPTGETNIFKLIGDFFASLISSISALF